MTALATRIASSSLRAYTVPLLSFVRPAIRLRPVDPSTADTSVALGTTRFGGMPDVGARFRWPGGASPLSFLLQLDLAHTYDMPALVQSLKKFVSIEV